MPPSLRVGSVPYLVGRPLDSGLEDEPGLELVRQVPARLVERLRSAELDVALVSSIELFRAPGYGYLDGIAVAGRGFVASVQVFLRRPIDDVRRVAVDPSSRAAAALVRVLLADRPGGPPEFLDLPLGEDPRAADADAWLRIGDEALREYLADVRPVFNPSEEWTRRTGLPFVFAAWIVRGGVAIEGHLGAFLRARERGRDQVRELARRASLEWKLPHENCLRYLTEECLYDPGARMGPALDAFRKAATAAGVCPEGLVPTPIPLPELPCPG